MVFDVSATRCAGIEIRFVTHVELQLVLLKSHVLVSASSLKSIVCADVMVESCGYDLHRSRHVSELAF